MATYLDEAATERHWTHILAVLLVLGAGIGIALVVDAAIGHVDASLAQALRGGRP